MVSAKTVETDRNTSAILPFKSAKPAFLTNTLVFLRDDWQPVSCGSSGQKWSLLEPGLASPFLSHIHPCRVCIKVPHAAIAAFGSCLWVQNGVNQGLELGVVHNPQQS